MMNRREQHQRYPSLVALAPHSATIVSRVNPWAALWWSAAFPGYGHFLLGYNLTAYVFICFEFTVNTMSHMNEAIYQSMVGNFEEAKSVLNLRWFFGYISVFVFAMYDCYTRAVGNNKQYRLSSHYTKYTQLSVLSTLMPNSIEKSSPWTAIFWSILTPSISSVLTRRLPVFIFSIVWWGVAAVMSNLFVGIYYTAVGRFTEAAQVLDPQWFLFIPSLMGFATYLGYNQTVQANKQFALSQAQYLREAYQDEKFVKPL